MIYLNPMDFDSRKKLLIYECVDLKSNYWIIYIINSKSRFILKNALEISELTNKIITSKGHNYKFKALIVTSPICSKAKDLLLTYNWSVYNDFMWYWKFDIWLFLW